MGILDYQCANTIMSLKNTNGFLSIQQSFKSSKTDSW